MGGFPRYKTDQVEELRLPPGGAFVITDEQGTELFRVTAEGGAVKVAGLTLDPTLLANLEDLTASITELNLLTGAGALVASGTAAEPIEALEEDVAIDDTNAGSVAADAKALIDSTNAALNAVIAALVGFGIVEAVPEPPE